MKKITKVFIVVDICLIALFALLYTPALRSQIESVLKSNKALTSIIYGESSSDEQKTIGYVDETVLEDVETADVKVTRISVIGTGDALIHNTVYNTHETEDGGYNFDDIFDYITPIVQQYDIAYYNQETILGGTELGLSNYPQFNSPQEVGDAFVKAGFNLVSLANNHTLDGMYRYGTSAIENSRAYWDQQYEDYGVYATGSWTSWDERSEVVIQEVRGVTYAMLSYTTVTNMLYPPDGQEYLTNFYSEEKVLEDIAVYRDQVDVLIVAMHWGVDYILTPNSQEKEIAQFLAENGVDIIFGCHGHYIQPIAMVDDTLVFYGLGNFVSAQNESRRTYALSGVLVSFDIVKTEVDGEVSISFEEVTAQLTYNFRNQNFKVIPYSEFTTAEKSNRDTVFEKLSGVLTSMWDEVTVY